MTTGRAVNSFTARSVSHHTVLSNGRTWVKVARDTTDLASAELEREHRVLDALNIKHGYSPGPPATLTTPHLGDPVSTDDFMTLAFLPALLDYQQVHVPGLPDGASRVGAVREKVTRRVTDPDLRQWCTGILDRVGAPDLTGAALCHTDPHAGNWVRDPAGQHVLIDWESAVTAAPEVDGASVAHSLFLLGDRDVGRRAGLLDGLNMDVLQAALTVKMVSGVSWVAATSGVRAARERVDYLRDGPAWFIPVEVSAQPW